jgi:hypothetical protein
VVVSSREETSGEFLSGDCTADSAGAVAGGVLVCDIAGDESKATQTHIAAINESRKRDIRPVCMFPTELLPLLGVIICR